MFDFFSLYQAAIATIMLLSKQAQNLNIYFLSIGLCWAVVLLHSARICWAWLQAVGLAQVCSMNLLILLKTVAIKAGAFHGRIARSQAKPCRPMRGLS